MNNNYSNVVLFGQRLNPIDPHQIKIIDVIGIYPHKENMVFIEVGANDGITNDPIYNWAKKYHWQGVLIEPVKSSFNKMVQNYAGIDNIKFENCAISSINSKISTIFVPKSGNMGAASLNRAHPPLRGKYKTQKVAISSLDNIIKKYDLCQLDFLQIDAEGKDFEVLQTIDLSCVTPKIIHYEHRHLSKKDKQLCQDYLINNWFLLYFNRNNTVCIHKSIEQVT